MNRFERSELTFRSHENEKQQFGDKGETESVVSYSQVKTVFKDKMNFLKKVYKVSIFCLCLQIIQKH